MAQDPDRRLPTTGTLGGLALVTEINGIIAAIEGGNKGAAAPAAPAQGLFWLDDSAGATWTLKIYDGNDWITLFTINTTGNTAEAPFKVATQAELEAATSLVAAATPGRMHHHPGVAKAWAKFGTTGNILNDYGVSSITDNAVGDATVNFSTAFSSADYGVNFNILDSNHTTTNRGQSATSQLAGSVRLLNEDSAGANLDPVGWYVVAFGDQ